MYKPIQLSTSDDQNTYQLKIDKFLGCDYRSGDIVTNMRRSPDALNMTFGINPYTPTKRTGYKKLLASAIGTSNINGIFYLGDDLLLHAGTKLYLVGGTEGAYTTTELYNGLTDTLTTSFVMNSKLYILGGGTYLQYDGTTASAVSSLDDVFEPTTTIGRNPDGTSGTSLEAVNLLTPKRANSFLSDGTAGIREVSKLVIEHAATNSGNITVTLGGTGNTVAVLAGDTLYEVAQKIRNFAYSGWTASGTDEYIIFTCDTTGTNTDASFTDTDSTLVDGTMTTIIQGSASGQAFYLDAQDIDDTEVTATTVSLTRIEDTDFTVYRDLGVVVFNSVVAAGIDDIDNVVIHYSKTITGDKTDYFQGNGSKLLFKLEYKNIDADSAVVYKNGLEITTGFTVDEEKGEITFTVAPALRDIIKVEYSKASEAHAQIINLCRFSDVYGGENDTRVFVTGNSNYPNRDYQSGLYNPTYFPDTGYTLIGSDNNEITGYVKQYNTQVILKSDSTQDSTQYLRTFSISSSGVVSFPIDQGSTGVGCLSHYSLGNLYDEPLFLSKDGVMALSGTSVDNQRNIQQRSEMVNSRLLDDATENSIGVVYKGKYHLFVNGHVYVCDARMRYRDEIGNYQYEWHYWDNVTCQSAAVIGDYLYFGNAGQLYRFYLDSEARCYNDDGEAISCQWVTPMFNFDNWSRLKNIQMSVLTLEPFAHSGVSIYVSVDGEDEELADEAIVETIWDFGDFDFSTPSFNTSNKPRTYVIKNKIKKVSTVQFFYKNAVENDGFAISTLQYNYTFGAKVKGSA